MATDNRQAKAWYVRFPLDAYALGPYRFNEPKTAEYVAQEACKQFGELPVEVWPTGPVEEIDEYEYELQI